MICYFSETVSRDAHAELLILHYNMYHRLVFTNSNSIVPILSRSLELCAGSKVLCELEFELVHRVIEWVRLQQGVQLS